MTETKGLRVEFKHYDADNAKNEHEHEVEVHVADLGLTYVQEVNAADNSQLIQKRHEIVKKRKKAADLVDLSFVGANKKLKQQRRKKERKRLENPKLVLNYRRKLVLKLTSHSQHPFAIQDQQRVVDLLLKTVIMFCLNFTSMLHLLENKEVMLTLQKENQ